MQKYSRQREAVMSFLQGRTDHPTADVVYESLRKEHPSLSLGTVYRNLGKLAESGAICAISTGDGKVHFDWNTAPHGHFTCKCCGALLDLPVRVPASLTKDAERRFDGEIDSYSIFFTGTCPDCLEAMPIKKDA